MKILKRILLGLVIVVALILGVGFFLPREITVSRSTIIPAPQWKVYNPIADLTLWDNWAVWNQVDPDMKKTWGPIQKGEGASYSWTSDHPMVGTGSLTITSVKGMDELDMKLVFGGQGESTSSFTLTPTPEGTGVTWTITSDMGAAPWGRLMGLMMDSWIGPDFEKGLQQLADYVATNSESMEISRVTVPSKHVLFVTMVASQEQVQPTLASCYQKVSEAIAQQGLQVDGHPYSVFNYTEEGKVEITAGIPVDSLASPQGDVQYAKYPSTEAVKANYYGGYNGVGNAYTRVVQELEKMGLKPTNEEGPLGWEEYVTDPGMVADSTQWLTEVYVPVRSYATNEQEEMAE